MDPRDPAAGIVEPPLTREAVAARLAGLLDPALTVWGDEAALAHPGEKPLTPAAVLVPLINRPAGVTVMLTVAGAESTCPSFTLKVKLSPPL